MENSGYFIEDRNGRRYIKTSAKSNTILGGMSIAEPDKMLFPFAYAMMSFLVFMPKPREILMVGLGAGAQAKFIRRNMPDTNLTAVEIDPAIVKIARSHFNVPQDGERFRTFIGDAKDFMPKHPSRFDIILSDAYENDVVPDALTTEIFYRDCHQALRGEGILIINFLWYDLGKITAQINILSSIFNGGVLMAPAVGESNIILFCFRKRPSIGWPLLHERARELEAHYSLGLPQFVDDLKVRSRLVHDFDPLPI